MDPYFIQCVIIQYYHYLNIQFVPDLAGGSPFWLPPMSFQHVPIILWELPYIPAQVIQAHLYFYYSSSGITVLQGCLMPFIGKLYLKTKIWD